MPMLRCCMISVASVHENPMAAMQRLTTEATNTYTTSVAAKAEMPFLASSKESPASHRYNKKNSNVSHVIPCSDSLTFG